MKTTINPFLGLGIVLFFLLSSCSNTVLKSVWVDQNYKGQYLSDVMVIGVTDNEADRKLFEDEFVSQFNSHKIRAISSIGVISMDNEMNRDIVLEKAAELGVTTLFVTHLIGVDKKEVYYPTTIDATSYPHYYNRFNTYYPAVYSYVNAPGYYLEHEYVNLESNIYDAKTGSLIWSVKSEAFAPKSTEEIIRPLSKVVFKNLQENKLIK